VSERGEQLAARLDEQFADVIGLVSGLKQTDLVTACHDPQGHTVGGVLAHLRDGTDLVLGWAAAVTGQPPAASGPGPANGERAADPTAASTAAALRHGQDELGRTIRALTDEQLDIVPPSAGDLTDGTKQLHEIFDFILDDLRGHASRMKEALAVAGETS
jgi:hypothetical protein